MNIKKIIREEIDNLDWIINSEGEPIDGAREAYVIVCDYFNGKGVINYKDLHYNYNSFGGTIEWGKYGGDIVYYATPYWNEGNTIPIDYQYYDGDYGSLSPIKIPDFKIKDELIDWLKNSYPEIIYQKIMEHGKV